MAFRAVWLQFYTEWLAAGTVWNLLEAFTKYQSDLGFLSSGSGYSLRHLSAASKRGLLPKYLAVEKVQRTIPLPSAPPGYQCVHVSHVYAGYGKDT